MPALSIKVDRREFDRSLRRLFNVSDIRADVLVNRKGYRVHQKAVWYAPVTPAEKIQEELEAHVATELVKLKNGRFSKAKKNLKTFFGSGSEAPLLALIIQSWAKLGHPSPWKGVNRAEGAIRMLDKMRRVYAGRQKSRGYFKSCFATIRDIFKQASGSRIPLSDQSSRGSGTQSSLVRDRGRIADATPATGKNNAKATFWLTSAKRDKKGAIVKYAAPALQKAFDEEGEDNWKRALELEFKEACRQATIKTK